MVNLAILHSTLPQYLSDTAQEADQRNMKVAVATADPAALLASAGKVKVDALVADLELLGANPEVALAEFERVLQPELTVIVYAFAKWEVIERLRGPRRQLMRAPISARSLRSRRACSSWPASCVPVRPKLAVTFKGAPPSATASADAMVRRKASA